MVMQRFERFPTNLGNLHICQDVCYVQMTDNNEFLTIYRHHANLLNNKIGYKNNSQFCVQSGIRVDAQQDITNLGFCSLYIYLLTKTINK